MALPRCRAAALRDAGHDRLPRRAAPPLAARAPAADVRLVDLDLTAERAAVFGQHLADLAEHPPRRLVGDAEFALELLRGDAAARRGHEVDRVEPEAERCG